MDMFKQHIDSFKIVLRILQKSIVFSVVFCDLCFSLITGSLRFIHGIAV